MALDVLGQDHGKKCILRCAPVKIFTIQCLLQATLIFSILFVLLCFPHTVWDPLHWFHNPMSSWPWLWQTLIWEYIIRFIFLGFQISWILINKFLPIYKVSQSMSWNVRCFTKKKKRILWQFVKCSYEENETGFFVSEIHRDFNILSS